jgi:uncharacterized protein involved in tolerance to divalent cations
MLLSQGSGNKVTNGHMEDPRAADQNNQDQDKHDPVSAIFVTAASDDEARSLATALLRDKLVACVNLVPGVESFYEWEGRLETSHETMMLIKVISVILSEWNIHVLPLGLFTFWSFKHLILF